VWAGLASVGTLLVAWEVAAVWGASFVRILPPPSRFLPSLVASHFKIGLGAQAASVYQSVASSAMRVFCRIDHRFFVVVGNWTSDQHEPRRSPRRHADVRLLAPIAPIAWIPLGLVVFGIGNQTAVFNRVHGRVLTLTIATIQGIDNVPQSVIDNAATLGCSRLQLWMYAIFPAILPGVFTTLRLNFIAAWMAVLAAEMTGLQDGLGAIVMIGRNLFDNNLILLGMCLIGVTGFGGDLVLRVVQTRLFWWGNR